MTAKIMVNDLLFGALDLGRKDTRRWEGMYPILVVLQTICLVPSAA